MNTKLNFSVGPSKLFPTVKAHLRRLIDGDQLSFSHRSEEFRETIRNTKNSIRLLNGIPSNFEIFFVSSATEVWERLIQNCIHKKSYHLVNGLLSLEFMKTSKSLGRTVEFDEINLNEDISKILNSTKAAGCEAICLTHNESSLGMVVPNEIIYNFRERYPDKLIFVDCTSSYPCINFELSKIDSFFFSVQKCFGLPSGLGVWCLNEKGIIKSHHVKSLQSIGSYHSVPKLLSFSKKNETPETPNMLGIALLGNICNEMIPCKTSLLHSDIQIKKRMLYDYISEKSKIKPLIQNANYQSSNIICCEFLTSNARAVMRLLDDLQISVSSGLPHFGKEYIRIANFPSHSIDEYLLLIERLETLHSIL